MRYVETVILHDGSAVRQDRAARHRKGNVQHGLPHGKLCVPKKRVDDCDLSFNEKFLNASPQVIFSFPTQANDFRFRFRKVFSMNNVVS